MYIFIFGSLVSKVIEGLKREQQHFCAHPPSRPAICAFIAVSYILIDNFNQKRVYFRNIRRRKKNKFDIIYVFLLNCLLSLSPPFYLIRHCIHIHIRISHSVSPKIIHGFVGLFLNFFSYQFFDGFCSIYSIRWHQIQNKDTHTHTIEWRIETKETRTVMPFVDRFYVKMAFF